MSDEDRAQRVGAYGDAGVTGTGRDATAGRAERQALELDALRFRGLFEGAGSGIVIAELDGRLIDANEPFLEMIGYPLDEIRQADISAITHPDDRGESGELLAELLAGGRRSFTFEKRYLRKDGTTKHGRTTVSMIRDGDGAPLNLVATVEDLSPTLQTMERLTRSETLRRLAGGLALVGGWSVEATPDRTTYWSDEIFRVLDVPTDVEPLDEAFLLHPGPDRERVVDAIEACLEHGRPFDVEVEIDTYSGRRIPVRVIGEPELDSDGRLERVVGAFQDISETARARDDAVAIAKRLAETLESMSDAVYVFDADWNFTFVNRRGELLVQRDRDQLLGRNLWVEFPEAVGSVIHDAFPRAVSENVTQTVDECFYPPLGIWLAATAYPSSTGLVAYVRDVTETHVARDLLVQQAELLDAAQDAILVSDESGRIQFWNRGAERIYGWTADEVVGRRIRDLLYDDPSSFDSAARAVFRDGHWSGELVHRTRDGETRTMAVRWTLAVDERGSPDAVLAINTDITDRLRAEQQLMRVQRLESIGTLASGIAHNLNNVLTPIAMAAGLLREQLDEQGQSLVETIETSADRGADLVAKVLSFARGVEGERRSVDVRQVVDGAAAIVRDTFPKNIQLELRIPPAVSAIVADSTQVQQVLLNLAVNARDAMPDGGLLTIGVGDEELDADALAGEPGCEPGAYVVIDVEDSGVGMAPETVDRIFDPFFTTKPHGSGTGLGLATSAAILKSHHGFLRVDSQPGRGSRFRVCLPTGPDQPVIADPVPDEELFRGSGHVVLVIDDEDAIRAMTRRTLESAGYRVLEARDGAEGVGVFTHHCDSVAVVIVDMMMPVMDGPATVAALRELDARLPIIGVSGLEHAHESVRDPRTGVQVFLTKPYTGRRLLAAVASVSARSDADGSPA